MIWMALIDRGSKAIEDQVTPVISIWITDCRLTTRSYIKQEALQCEAQQAHPPRNWNILLSTGSRSDWNGQIHGQTNRTTPHNAHKNNTHPTVWKYLIIHCPRCSYTCVIENIIFCAMQLSVSDNIIKFVGCLLWSGLSCCVRLHLQCSKVFCFVAFFIVLFVFTAFHGD